jgi:hypothetical protein
VEELEDAERSLSRQGDNRGRKVERLASDRRQHARKGVAHHERRQQLCGQLRQLDESRQGVGIYAGPAVGHVQAAIRRQALKQGLAETDRGLGVARTRKPHRARGRPRG